MSSARASLLAVALLLANASALSVSPLPRAHGTQPPLRAACLRACDTATELAMPAESTGEEGSDERPDGPQPGDFLKWYRREKAIEQYKKDNPQDPLQAAWSRIDGPAKTLAVLTLGYCTCSQGPRTQDMAAAPVGR